MSDDEALYARLRRQVDQCGEGSLNRLDLWRWRTMSAERQRREPRFDLVEQQRAEAMITTGRIHDEVASLRAAQDQLVGEINDQIKDQDKIDGAVLKIFNHVEARQDQQEGLIAQLRSEVADLKVKLAEAGAEELATLQHSLVDAARLTVDCFHAAAVQRERLSEKEASQADELAALNARAAALADEVERLKDAQKNVRFAREQDDDTLDLPSDFLLPFRGNGTN